jgi:dTDP-4-dehydrorhamnose reductase
MNEASLELWGGIECTVNRVGDTYHDQLSFSGHARRDSDLHALGTLGIKSLRYPVLWEHAAPRSADDVDFTWADRRLTKIRELGITPIAGLLHRNFPGNWPITRAKWRDVTLGSLGSRP